MGVKVGIETRDKDGPRVATKTKCCRAKDRGATLKQGAHTRSWRFCGKLRMAGTRRELATEVRRRGERRAATREEKLRTAPLENARMRHPGSNYFISVESDTLEKAKRDSSSILRTQNDGEAASRADAACHGGEHTEHRKEEAKDARLKAAATTATSTACEVWKSLRSEDLSYVAANGLRTRRAKQEPTCRKRRARRGTRKIQSVIAASFWASRRF